MTKKQQKQIPDGWEMISLESVSIITMGQSPSSKYYNETGEGIPLIQGNADIIDGNTIERIFTTEITKESIKGDIILTVRAPVGDIGIVNSQHICIGRGVCSIKSNKKSLQQYLFFFLSYFKPKWKAYEQGSTFTAISSKDVRKLPLLLPPLPEQKRIVAVLETWDKYLELLDKKIKVKKKIKKGLMQRLLSGEVRLPGFSGEWKKKSFNKIFDVLTKPRGLKSSEYGKSGIPIVDQSTDTLISGYTTREELAYPYSEKEPVILFGDHSRVIKLIDFKATFANDGIKLFKQLKDVDLRWGYYTLLNYKVPETGYNRHFKYLKGAHFYVPNQEEQSAIADILSTADEEIQTLEEKRKFIREQKKFLLNNLVTGKIRVPESINIKK